MWFHNLLPSKLSKLRYSYWQSYKDILRSTRSACVYGSCRYGSANGAFSARNIVERLPKKVFRLTSVEIKNLSNNL
jgi:hypothetical protein